MLLLKTEEIPLGGKSLEATLSVEWLRSLVFEEVYRADQPLKVALLVKKAKTHIRVTGRIDTQLTATCCRCLTPTLQAFSAEIDQKYFPATVTLGPLAPLDDGSDELDQFYYKGNVVDLESGIRERFVFELNPHPVCTEQCEMPRESQAEVPGEAQQEPRTDPRWAKLRDIKLD